MEKKGLTISTVLHCLAIAWAALSFARPLDVKPAESMPVDIISAEQFSQLTKGAKTAPKKEEPKPLVEKIAEAKPVEDPTPKIVEKQKEIVATTEEKVELPTPKPPEPKKAAAPPTPPKEEAKAPEPKKAEEQKIDPIAEALKKEDTKKPEKKVEVKKPPLPPKPEKQQPKFDPRQVAALLDKRDAQRMASAGDALSPTASLGAPSGSAAHLSQSEIDALKARLMALWNPPAGASNPQELVVQVRIHLGPDGKLTGPPEVLTSGQSVLFQASRESAMRAIFRGQPFNMLRPATYDQWRDIDITFDPRDLLRG
jgi:outer membrane biosynthesis protein TonB